MFSDCTVLACSLAGVGLSSSLLFQKNWPCVTDRHKKLNWLKMTANGSAVKWNLACKCSHSLFKCSLIFQAWTYPLAFQHTLVKKLIKPSDCGVLCRWCNAFISFYFGSMIQSQPVGNVSTNWKWKVPASWFDYLFFFSCYKSVLHGQLPKLVFSFFSVIW